MAIEAARAGGLVLREHFRREAEVFAKEAGDVVTTADHASEAAILARIRETFPSHAIFAEEAGAQAADSEYLWVVDPLDGTHNFVLGLPYFSVSVALQYAGQLVLGVVYHPLLDDVYVAEQHRGAELNGQRLHVTDLGDLNRAIAYYDQGYAVEREAGLRAYTHVASATRRCLHLWSPALDWCTVARGRAHLIVVNQAEVEDKLAGVLILQEAGGVVTDWSGQPPSFDVLRHPTTSLIGCAPGLHAPAQRLVDALQSS